MANIKPYTDQISSAQYGEEVRGSIVNALTAMNNDINNDTASARAYANQASQYASNASSEADRAESVIETGTASAIAAASGYADAAANSAEEAAATEERLADAVQDAKSTEAAIESAEAARVTAENNRVNAESERVSAEQARESQETGYVAQCADYTEQCRQFATNDYARNAESWAVGGTGARYGEDTNNAKYWCSQAEKIAGGDSVLAFNGRQGLVLPELGDYTSDLIGRGSGTVESALSGIEAELLNKANKTDVSGKAPTNHASNADTYGLGTTAAYGHVKTVNNLTTSAHTNGLALSAYQGKVLNESIADINNKLLSTTTDLNTLINQTTRGHMTHIFAPSATGAPNTTWSGFCETLIVSTSYAAQWAYLGSGRIYVRARDGSTISNWALVYSNQTVTVTDVNVNSKNIQARMVGNMCHVSGWVTPKAQTYSSVSTALVKLSVVPTARTFFIGVNGSTGSCYGMEITANGNIVFNSSSPTFSGNPYIYFNFTFIVD